MPAPSDLAEALQREQCFVGDACHELRSSLAILACAAETIRCQLPPDSALLASAERMLRSTQEMEQQLHSLLLLARAPQQLVRTAIFLRPLVQDCMDRCRPWLVGKPVVLVLEEGAEVQAHANLELLRSLVWNLLRNACQYTVRGEVRIRLLARRLVIADTGPGLPAHIDPQHFARFVPSARSGGQGLGLSIVQRLVAQLGWRMEVDSSVQGCRFGLRW